MDFTEKNYYIRNNYTMGTYLHFDDKITIDVADEQIIALLDDEIYSKGTGQCILSVTQKDLGNDSYTLDIKPSKEIIVTYSTYRSLRYAVSALNNMVVKTDSELLLPICNISDKASFKYRGIIEGYYGAPWTTANRLDMVDFMDENRLNIYMYAPKDDDYHRKNWYKLYKENKVVEFKELIDKMDSKGIDFCYCISPGYHKADEIGFDYTTNKDFKRLFKKLDQLIALGVHSFGLLLDDIDYKLKGDNLEKYKRPGVAHAHICNKVYDYLKENVEDLYYVMCPTEYHQVGETEYRTDLKENLEEGIEVFWTGTRVCAEVITERQASLTRDAFGRSLTLWENFPVTDFAHGSRQFMAPLENRCTNLCEYITGFIINPMEFYEISKVSMITEAHYAWNSQKYNPEMSFEIALSSYGEDFYMAIEDYIIFNYNNVLNYGNREYENMLFNTMDKEAIKDYYAKTLKSANSTLKLDLPIVKELKPWLKRVKKEKKVVNMILDGEACKEDILSLYKDKHISGSELCDLLAKPYLSDTEYKTIVMKKRGGSWYRVWEKR